LNSGYAELFGAPLSAYGAAAYASVAALAFWGSGMQNELVAQGENRDRTLESSYARARVLLFFGATGLAGVSSYLLFVLAVKLGGVECVYCLTSAALSLTLFGVGFAGLSSKESGKALPAAIALYLVTLASMSIVLTGVLVLALHRAKRILWLWGGDSVRGVFPRRMGARRARGEIVRRGQS
jgi:uncharacterized membrane protein